MEVLLLTDEADLESALPELESFAQSVQRAPLDDPGAATSSPSFHPGCLRPACWSPSPVRWRLLVAVGLLLPDTRMAAAVCSLALMLAMFGANVYASRMADPTGYAGAAPSRSFPWPPP